MVEVSELAVHDRDWRAAAACRTADPAIFFHPARERAGEREHRLERAQAICARCPVQRQCHDHALAAAEDYGVWGGIDEGPRRAMIRKFRRERREQATQPTA